MLVFSPQSLAFIAVPKTGTTALEMALKPRADILFSKHRKHMTAQRFHKKIAPFLAETFNLRPDRFAVIREPEEQIRSWYRYRSGPRQKGGPNATGGIDFDSFVRAVISQDPPPYAGIGSQINMLVSGRGEVLVHRLFAYEAQPRLRAFLNDRFGEEITIKQKNISPEVEAPLSDDTRALLRHARAAEFALYDRVMQAGGELVSSPAHP